MTISPIAIVPTDARPRTRPWSRSARRRAGVAVLGTLLAGLIGLTPVGAAAAVGSAAATGSGSSISLAVGGRSFGGGGYAPWSTGSATTTTVDSEPATPAEEKGVALIDTVLTGGTGAGTGIVLTADGEVLTNYHVVEDSTTISVTIASTGRSYRASVIGADPTTDVALLQLKDATGLAVAAIDDDSLQTGDQVTAVGNAGGTGELTAADGMVLDLSTSLTTESEGTISGEELTGMIETDADVVAGDSGGPLLNDEGEVVGIDTAASSGQVINGYAIPIAVAMKIVEQIQDGDESASVRIGRAAFLGVELSSLTGTTPYSDYASGATIAGVVADGSADRAGLTAGDTITRIGSTTISDATELSDLLSTRDPGDKIKITWVTAAGKSESATVTLGSSPLN